MRNALLIAAGVLVTVGVGCVFWPAGLIVAGLLVGAFTILSE